MSFQDHDSHGLPQHTQVRAVFCVLSLAATRLQWPKSSGLDACRCDETSHTPFFQCQRSPMRLGLLLILELAGKIRLKF
jgi:hypothetical protein